MAYSENEVLLITSVTTATTAVVVKFVDRVFKRRQLDARVEVLETEAAKNMSETWSRLLESMRTEIERLSKRVDHQESELTALRNVILMQEQEIARLRQGVSK